MLTEKQILDILKKNIKAEPEYSQFGEMVDIRLKGFEKAAKEIEFLANTPSSDIE